MLSLKHRIWDARKLTSLAVTVLSAGPPTPPPSSPVRGGTLKTNFSENVTSSSATNVNPSTQIESIEFDIVEKYKKSSKGKGILLADWEHKRSVTAAYWDPRGRSVVSTCYDDTLRRECLFLFASSNLGPFAIDGP